MRALARSGAVPEIAVALAAFAVLGIAVLSVAARLVEPDDLAYRASIVAMTDGHFLFLSHAQYQALGTQLARSAGPVHPGSPLIPPIAEWSVFPATPSGRWISEKNPGYPFLAAPFQALGIIRLAPLFYGAAGCLGLFAGARRWLGRWGGAAAVGLFCSSGAALLFAWRDYMPTFTEASLIAAGGGALLWAVLAAEATARRRTWAGLAGFVALEAAVFTRYTDVVVLGCAAAAAAVAWRLRKVPTAALAWWLGSAATFGAGVAVFDDLVYGGPLRTGYQRPGEVQFSLSAIGPNLRYVPADLVEAMPVLVLGLAALAWIAGQRLRARRAGGEQAVAARRDLAVGLALASSWFGVWGLYAAYTWTAQPGGSSLQVVRFYVDAIGPIALLGAWLVVRVTPRASLAGVTSAAVVAAMFGLGIWSYNDMRAFNLWRTAPSAPAHTTSTQVWRCRSQPSASPAIAYTAPRSAGREGDRCEHDSPRSIDRRGLSASARGRCCGSSPAPGAQSASGTSSVLEWGANASGQLGVGKTTQGSRVPVTVKLPTGTKVTAIAAGGDTLAVTSTGSVLAWGYNAGGELGDGSTASSDVPVKVKLPAGTKVTAIAAGKIHSLAVTSTGSLLAWGDNTAGELGDGKTTQSDVPVKVKLPAGTKVTAVATGCVHSLAVTSTGAVLAWGFNGHGQLGDGSTASSDVPVKVKLPAGTKATELGAGSFGYWSLALVHRG